MYSNNIEGWMLEEEVNWLYETSKLMSNVVEIGSWKGRSTHALLSGCNGAVYAVDHFKGADVGADNTNEQAKFEDIHSIFLQNVGHFHNLVLLKMSSEEASKLFTDKYFDMVFIDGTHAYDVVMNDIKLWYPKTKRVVCGHDYGSPCGVKQAVDDYFTPLVKTVHNKVHSIWYVELSIEKI